MRGGGGSCCDSGGQQQPSGGSGSAPAAGAAAAAAAAAADAARFGLPDPAELADDPVLAGCCAEDLANFRASAALKQALLEADRSTVRQKLRAQVLPPPPAAEGSGQGSGEGDEEDDDEDDPVLAQLRRQRLADMQRQAAERQERSQQGYGALNELAASSLLGRVEALEGPCVVHLAVPGCEACSQLDEHLDALAHRHRGTFFARVVVRRGDAIAAQLRLTSVPGLACFRSGGAVVGRAPLSQLGPPDCVVEEEVTSYLQRLRVLASAPQERGATRAARGGGRSADGDTSGEEEEWRVKPCELCGRRYPHEHVRAVYGSGELSRGSSGSEG